MTLTLDEMKASFEKWTAEKTLLKFWMFAGVQATASGTIHFDPEAKLLGFWNSRDFLINIPLTLIKQCDFATPNDLPTARLKEIAKAEQVEHVWIITIGTAGVDFAFVALLETSPENVIISDTGWIDL